MSNELYYRGSEEYAVAVKNQLERMESQGIRDANKIAFNIQNMEYGIRSDIRQSTYAIVASQEMLRQTFQQGFDSVNNTLQLGFGMMAERLAGIENAVYQVGEEICNKLDEIHDIVNNPLLTASRELYRRALKNYQNGYFTEALEDIKQAVEKNKTDYISWELMGEIYLYGAGKFSNVINLDEAEKAFENAAKYIDADLSSIAETDTQKILNNDKEERAKFLKNKDFENFAAKIFFELGYTRLLKSNDLLVGGNETESTELLAKSSANLEDSFKKKTRPVSVMSSEDFDFYIRFLKILKNFNQKEIEQYSYNTFWYCKILTNLAKDKHFQGKDDEALDLVSKAIDADSNNALIFSTDKDFESLWSKIENLIEEKRKFLISKIEEERNKVSKLEFTQEKMNSVLSEYDSIVSGYKDAPFLSLAEMLKKAITLFGTNENEINEKKKFLQKLKDFIGQCSKNESYVAKAVSSSNIESFKLSDSSITSKWDCWLHIILSDSYPAMFGKWVESELYSSVIDIRYSSSVQKYIDKIVPNHSKIPFIDVLSKIKDDMEQNYVKVYSFAELNEFLDVLNSYLDEINGKKKAEEDRLKAIHEDILKEEAKDKKIGKGCGIGCLVFVLIWVVICVAMCVAGVK